MYEKVINILDTVSDKNFNEVFNKEKVIEKYETGEYKIVTENARYPLSNLSDIFKNHNLTPEYQRRRVWDDTRKSKLIESFIINVPVPPIFLYETDYAEYELMDGLQRVSTILSFLNNDFELSGLEIWSDLNGLKFCNLPSEIQRGITRRYLSATILLKETAKSKEEEQRMKQFVFERLNTGGLELSPQEIRNALYPSLFNDLLNRLSSNQTFKELWGFITDDDYKRMQDSELILRFFSYVSAIKLDKSIGTKKLLDSYISQAVIFNQDDINLLDKLFTNTISMVKDIFGIEAFKQLKGDKKSSKMIFDALMNSVANFVMDDYSEGDNIPDLSDKKFDLIFENQDDFNGKYTALSIVKKRSALIYSMLIEDYKKIND